LQKVSSCFVFAAAAAAVVVVVVKAAQCNYLLVSVRTGQYVVTPVKEIYYIPCQIKIRQKTGGSIGYFNLTICLSNLLIEYIFVYVKAANEIFPPSSVSLAKNKNGHCVIYGYSLGLKLNKSVLCLQVQIRCKPKLILMVLLRGNGHAKVFLSKNRRNLK